MNKVLQRERESEPMTVIIFRFLGLALLLFGSILGCVIVYRMLHGETQRGGGIPGEAPPASRVNSSAST